MKRLRIIVLVREGNVPPETLDGKTEKEIDEWKAEFDVISTLRELGHEVRPLGVFDDLAPIRDAITEWQPDIAFMLLEEFHGVVTYDHAIISYLELMRQPYTGCNPRGLLLSKDKAISKKILTYHRIPTPRFAVFPRGRKVRRSKRLEFPLFVKSVIEDASLGISQASIVQDDAALAERVAFIHEHTESDAIAEQYIDGRELYVGVLGNERLVVFPPWEMVFEKMPDNVAHIATRQVKWNKKYQEKHGIDTKKSRRPTAGCRRPDCSTVQTHLSSTPHERIRSNGLAHDFRRTRLCHRIQCESQYRIRRRLCRISSFRWNTIRIAAGTDSGAWFEVPSPMAGITAVFEF